jgi:hypothetical protein
MNSCIKCGKVPVIFDSGDRFKDSTTIKCGCWTYNSIIGSRGYFISLYLKYQRHLREIRSRGHRKLERSKRRAKYA